MMDNRDDDKKYKYARPSSSSKTMISLDQIKSLYIASGMDAKAISDNTFLPLHVVEKIVKDHKLPELRSAYIREGINKIQNQQVNQAQKIMDIELNFKKLRIIQLEKELEDYVAYFSRHGDFYKRHPVSGDVLLDLDGIPLQIKIPNISREINNLKESVTLSEGMKNLVNQLDLILNSGPKQEPVEDGVIDVDYTKIFGDGE